MEYIQPNITIEETIEIIKNKISSETPFSLTRFGDGEIHIINGTGDEGFKHKICREWGYSYPKDINIAYEDAKEILINSMVKSDIIGFMDENTRTLPAKFYNKVHWSLPTEFLEKIGRDINKTKICDHMIARSYELGNIDNFKEILNGKDLHIISPNKSQLEDKNLSKLLECNVSITNHPHSINFNNRNEFMEDFKHIKEPVVVFGTGLIKDYGVYLRDNFGKITLDLGATLDAWSGILSRPWFGPNNKQNYLVI
jgi:hypothetical protein